MRSLAKAVILSMIHCVSESMYTAREPNFLDNTILPITLTPKLYAITFNIDCLMPGIPLPARQLFVIVIKEILRKGVGNLNSCWVLEAGY